MKNLDGSARITLLIAGFLLFGFSSLAVADDEPKDGQYNNILNRSSVNSDGDIDVIVREILFPPGWQAPTHFHNPDLFVYIIEGELELTMEHTGQVVYSAGQVLEMRSKTIMDARNPSDTVPIKLAVFQVGAADAPFMVPVE